MKSKLFFFLSLLLINSLNAQTKVKDYPDGYYTTVIVFLLIIISLIAVGFLFYGIDEAKIKEKKDRKMAEKFGKIKQKITLATPLEKESEIMLDHDFDGIKELDNRIPPWFSYLFYATIIISIGYMLQYHVINPDDNQANEYAAEMQAAQIQHEELVRTGVFITEETAALIDDPSSIDNGKQIFMMNCVACHAPDGGGLVGPNLTDDYWINGGGIKNIFRTVSNGVPQKGMIAWKTQLNPKQIQDVANFIIKLKGTRPAAPKAPEGTKELVDSTRNMNG